MTLDAAAIAVFLEEVRAADLAGPDAAEAFRIHWLGRKGRMKDILEAFRDVPGPEKREMGQHINGLKAAIEARLAEALAAGATERVQAAVQEDWSRPSGAVLPGTHHPISRVRREICTIFESLGFAIAEGPEIEDDWHVFSGLGFPPEHPARDMQDTFFIADSPGLLLRTHTSSVQVREMETRQPPMRIIMPGRVFRNEAISARAHCMFHQIEGLCIDEGVTFADLKQMLLHFAQAYFGPQARIRLRPSYFPFTEPSAEVDVYWGLETEVDRRITKGTGWLEILGCGMVDPDVLAASGIDPERYSGYAFGMGIERIAMLRHQIGDLRAFFENDVRFLHLFTGAVG